MKKIYRSTEKQRESARQWRLDNPDRYRELQRQAQARRRLSEEERVATLAAQQAAWAAQRGKIWTSTDYRRFIQHGLTPLQIDALFTAQGEKCALCWIKKPRGKSGWHLDHDHTTGAVRGLLCGPCNVALGMLEDDAERCRRAAAYIEFSALL